MNDESESAGIRRRSFFTAIGAGVIGATAAREAPGQPREEPGTSGPITVNLAVNGRKCRVAVEPRATLLSVLRERLGLTGTKVGCERGECGACTVLIDGVPRYACLTLAAEAEGRQITTIEGLMRGEELGTVQRAFVEKDGMQCGYCTPGQVVAAEALLRRNPTPSVEEIREAMSGNLCRCGAYRHIVESVQRASELSGKGDAS